jgi:hypothetical protein
VAEQRYRAVLDVAAGVPVTEVAGRYGVSPQSVHAWVRRYEQGGLGGLMDRSRPKNAREGMRPGRCTGKAHRREYLGYAGRRVLVSRKWSGKTLADHRADRKNWLLQTLGLSATDPNGSSPWPRPPTYSARPSDSRVG